MIYFKGNSVTIYALAKIYGVSWSELNRRYTAGRRDDDLVAPPRTPTRVEYDGEMLTLREAAKASGISYSTLFRRYDDGRRGDYLFTRVNGNVGDKTKAATKLNETTAKEVFDKAQKGDVTQASIAKEYNIDPSHVSDIKNKKRWA